MFAGVPSIIANASSTRALLPGSLPSSWAYRDDIHRTEGFPRTPLFLVSLAGRIIGALLLLFTPQRTFDSAIPWLMLAWTLLFALGSRISPILKRIPHRPGDRHLDPMLGRNYGGYFRRGGRYCYARHVVRVRPNGYPHHERVGLCLLGWGRSRFRQALVVSIPTKVHHRLSHIGNVRSAISTTRCNFVRLAPPAA